MHINFVAVIITAVISVIVGSIWYGPFVFGKYWMRLMGVTDAHGKMLISEAEMKRKQKESLPLYVLQLVLSLIMFTVFARLGAVLPEGYGLATVLSVWIGFVVPIQAGEVMWSGLSTDDKVKKFLVTAGYQLVMLLIASFVLSRF